MAQQDDTTRTDIHTGSGGDDWFDVATVDEPVSATKESPEYTGRRLTVLSDQQPSNPDPSEEGDGWFGSDPGSAASQESVSGDDQWSRLGRALPAAEHGDFDARTATLRSSDQYIPGPAPVGESWWHRHRGGVAVTVAVAVLGGAVVGAGVLLTGGDETLGNSVPLQADEIVEAPTPQAPAAASAAAVDFTWCAGQGKGSPVTEDSSDAGAAAIWRFEKAFYYDRSGIAARAAVAPDAVMASAQRLQEGIDALEPDVEFCVLADPISPGVYDATVVERGPSLGGGRIGLQRITTADRNGQTLITAIATR